MIGFLVGIFFAAGEYVIFWVVVGAIGWIFVRLGFNRGLSVFFVLMVGVVFGVFRFFVSEIVWSDSVSNLNGVGAVSVVGCVSGEVDVRVDGVKYVLSDIGVDGVEYRGNVLVNAGRYPVYEYGDLLSFYGEIEKPEMIEDFEYDKYLERYGVYSLVNNARVEKVGEGCGNVFFGSIFKFKRVVEGKIAEIYSEPHGSMVAGLLLGVRKGIPKELTEDFNETGLTHIVAISGYNITLVIVVVFGLFGFVGRKARVVFASVFVAVFVILVGAGSAVVRAGIMGVLGLFALYFGRQNQVGYAITLSAFLMNVVNPKIAVYDVGFQLSFLATLGLVYVSPRLKVVGGVFGRFLARVPVFFAIRENLIMTLSAQAFALPVILRSFGRFSFICPLANIFVLPFIPLIMLTSFVSIVIGFVSDWAGEKAAYVCYLLLEVVFFLVGFFADLSRMI